MAKSKLPQQDTPRQETIQERVLFVQKCFQDHADSLEEIEQFAYNNDEKSYMADLVGAMLKCCAEKVRYMAGELFRELEIPELEPEAGKGGAS